MNDEAGRRRPRDLAILLLAADPSTPRQRARDQRADLAGSHLERFLLDRVAAIDPEPDDLEAELSRIAHEQPALSGPLRAIGALILQEWKTSRQVPAYWEWLLRRAIEAGGDTHGHQGKRTNRHDP
jgi:hypothetical protein